MQFRKKPVQVEAWQITADLIHNHRSLPELKGLVFHINDPSPVSVTLYNGDGTNTLGHLGDWIVRTPAGKVGLYTRERFLESYDAVLEVATVSPTFSAGVYSVASTPAPPTQSVEQEIQAKGLTAPRVTPDMIEAVIKDGYYFTAAQGVHGASCEPAPEPLHLLTICVLELRNGFTVIGKSACASPENFNVDVGRRVAREDAVRQIWLLEGYLLKQKLHDASAAQ